ncbi:MAG: glucose-6-phosphate isomerase [Pseudomonadota bacterium]
MDFFPPHLCTVDSARGVLENANGRYEKRLRDLNGLYRDEDAFRLLAETRGEEIAYEVTSFTPGHRVADLIMGVTKMAPGKVGDEYFMTRGHIHAQPDRPEIYFGQKGNGLMLLESPQGDVEILEISAHSICYVPPFWIHRSVNTGAEEFVMMFAYPADAGQDYEIIAASGGMRVRVVDDGAGGWRAEDNSSYRPRTPETVRSILAKADALA